MIMDKSIEIRVSSATIELRAEGDAAPVISGYACLFDVPSQDLGGWTEVIKPTALTTIASDDVRLLVGHEQCDGPLARTSSGTLKLKVDGKGLFFEATLDPTDPDTQRLLPKIRRRDLTQMSFGFTCNKDQFVNEGGIIRRELLDISVCEISPVTFAAYPATSVAVRSMEGFKAEQNAIAAAKVKVLSLQLELESL